MTAARRHEASRDRRGGRLSGDRGSGLVAGITIMFALTFLALVALARDVDRGISNQSAAQSIAFQSARSGAQSVAIGDVRSGVLSIDPAAAQRAALGAANALFASYGVTGSVTDFRVLSDPLRVVIEVEIVESGVIVAATGVVSAVRTP